MNQTIKLNTDTKIPLLGLGTWNSPAGQAGEAVAHALKTGYTHIDCAAIYKNETEIGEAFERVFSGDNIKRENIFITSKLWNTEHAPSDVIKACKKSLSDLRLDYLDLYLMHWGVATTRFGGLEKISVRETWEAMEELVRQGLVRAIGVANFTGPMIIDLLTYAKIAPAVNQIELHPYLQQTELVKFCQKNDIVMTAYSPLGTPAVAQKKNPGTPILLEEEVITKIAAEHNKTPAQILIRWAMQRDTVVIPKSVTPARIEENFNVFDFELSDANMETIAQLNKNKRFVNPSDWWKISYFN